MFDKMHIRIMPEEDASVSAQIEELDLVANAPDEEQVCQVLVKRLGALSDDLRRPISAGSSIQIN